MYTETEETEVEPNQQADRYREREDMSGLDNRKQPDGLAYAGAYFTVLKPLTETEKRHAKRPLEPSNDGKSRTAHDNTSCRHNVNARDRSISA